jgi:hypothetical protein
MVVHFLTSVAGLARWSDYIPVKLVQGGPENSYSGTIDVAVIPSLTAATQAWKEYIPVYADDSATDAWTVNNIGYIPYNYALFNDAAMQLDLTNGAALDPRITFSRTTNATVTGSNGLIQYAPHNLLPFSEQFDNAAWFKAGVTITTNNTVSPDGTSTAETVTLSGATGVKRIFRTGGVTTLGAVYTESVFVKAGTHNFVQLAVGDQSSDFANFDLSSGAVGTTGGSVTATITLVGNSWYRISMTYTAGGTTRDIQLAFVSSSSSVRVESWTSLGTETVFIWGAQLEQSSTATTYNPTTVKNLLGFTEHFDNAAWTKSNSFVQTNLLLRSEEFDNAYWSKTASTVTANTTTAPDGSVTADSLIEAATTDFHSTFRGSLTLNAAAYTFSCFAKPNGRNEITLVLLSGADSATATFNVNTGAIAIAAATSGTFSSGSASITAAANGFYRVTLTATAPATGAATAAIELYNGARSYAGNGTSGIFLWGAQLVQGTSAGDYKATYAAAAAVGYTDIYGQPFAQKLVETTANAQHFINSGLVVGIGASVTLSCYAKAAERKRFTLRFGAVAPPNRATFDLVTGTVVDDLNASPIITPLGGGWFRCSINAVTTAAGIQTQAAYLNTDTGVATETYTGDGTSGIYIFGAQLSDSASVDPYVYQPVAAPASTAYYGPRFDYDPVTLAPKGLLIEEQRVNLLLRSEEFDNAAWTKASGGAGSAGVVTPNAGTDPLGGATADRLQVTLNGGVATADLSRVYQANATAASLTFSIWARSFDGTSTYAMVMTDANGTRPITVTPTWQRIDFSATSTGSVFYGIGLRGGQTPTNSNSADILIWGAQLEVGAFATSYIPTVASQVTRAADNASMIGNNFARWYNQNTGTFFAQSESFGDAAVRYITFASDASNNNRIAQYFGTATMVGLVTAGGTAQAAMSVSGVAPAKTALAYATDNFAFARNATLNTDSAGTVPVGLTQMQIGAGLTFTTSPLNGTISRIAYFNRRLANSELQGITS